MNTVDKLCSKTYPQQYYDSKNALTQVEEQIIDLQVEIDFYYGKMLNIYGEMYNFITQYLGLTKTTNPGTNWTINLYLTKYYFRKGINYTAGYLVYQTADIHEEAKFKPGTMIWVWDEYGTDHWDAWYVSAPCFFDYGGLIVKNHLVIPVLRCEDDTVPHSTIATSNQDNSCDIYKWNANFLIQKTTEFNLYSTRLLDQVYIQSDLSNTAVEIIYDENYTFDGPLPQKVAAEKQKTMLQQQIDAASINMEFYLPKSNWGDGQIGGAVTPFLDNNVEPNSIIYVSEDSFVVNGDESETLAPSGTILMNCGGMDYMGGEIMESTYVPPSAGNYTEIILSPDAINYPFLTNDIISICPYNTETHIPISGAFDINNDGTSFNLDGNQISFFEPFFDTKVVVNFASGLKKVAMLVSDSYYNEIENYTYIYLAQDLMLTSNLITISFNGITFQSGFEFVNQSTINIIGDWTNTLTPGLSGFWCDCGIDGDMPYTIASSEYKTGPCDYTLVTFIGGENSSVVPINENIEKIYVQPISKIWGWGNWSDWTYRKTITLSRPEGAVSNYVMQLCVGYTAGRDVNCNGNCSTDFKDLRFTNSEGVELPYWIEIIKGISPYVIVWIKFDYIGTTDTVFYMYYGNNSVSSNSNGRNTFLYFDDFERTLSNINIGYSGYSYDGNVSISSGQKFQGNNSIYITGQNIGYYGLHKILNEAGGDVNFALRTIYYKLTDCYFRIKIQFGNNYSALYYVADNENIRYSTNGTNANNFSPNIYGNINSWEILEVKNFNFTTYKYDIVYDVNNTFRTTDTGGLYNDGNTGDIIISWCDNKIGASANKNFYIDCVSLRPYVLPEPIWGIWSEEQIQ